MKRIVFVICVVFLLCGCSKQEEKSPFPTYVVNVSTGLLEGMKDLARDYGYDTFDTSIIISEYYAGQRIGANSIKDVQAELDYEMVANRRTEYITVRLDFEFSSYFDEPRVFTSYIAYVIYLEKGKETYIDFNEETLTSATEPR